MKNPKVTIECNVVELQGRKSRGSIAVYCSTIPSMIDVAQNSSWKCLYATIADSHGAIGAYSYDDGQVRAHLMRHYSEISEFIGFDIDKLNEWMTAAFLCIKDSDRPIPESFIEFSEVSV